MWEGYIYIIYYIYSVYIYIYLWIALPTHLLDLEDGALHGVDEHERLGHALLLFFWRVEGIEELEGDRVVLFGGCVG